jgi:hypothetical protein
VACPRDLRAQYWILTPDHVGITVCCICVPQVIANKEAGRSPVKSIGDTHFLYIKVRNMFAVAVAQGNVQVALAFQFLHEVVKVLKSYFGDFTEEYATP